ATGDDRRKLVSEPRSRVAEVRWEGFGDDRRLRAVLHGVRDESEAQREERQPGDAAVQESEVDEAPHAHDGRTPRVDLLPSDRVGEESEQWDQDEFAPCGDERADEHEAVRIV